MTFNLFILIWIAIACITFASLLLIQAPYGRYQRDGWGILIDNRMGWIIMEAISPISLSLFFWSATNQNTYSYIFYACWMIHYINRSFIFPLRIQTKGKKMPISIALMAVFFNSINGGINGYFLGYLAIYPQEWFSNPKFILGMAAFIIGMFINIYSDEILINLRKGTSQGYQIPLGFLYKYISCPNYFGEMIEWLGFALMTWSLPGLAFAIWTISNIFPRAIMHHKWYKEKFAEYPKDRKAVIPLIL